ncbi:TorF family putative porin [Croceibacterium aestuarii]|uniref:TorF family putative porin n=1 Tax=Croceibacterium aestuarii TaxID=3064139 RepID=UPI00272E6633|nr:TorF family putative porin [Croceibacterium sp. D39]
MLTSIRGLCAATALAGAAFLATPAMAEDENTSGFSISGNAAVVTDYRFRGVSLSGGDAAIQGGIDVAHDSGFYVGTWGSSIDGGAYGSTELDIYGGWSGDVASGLSADVGLLYYYYPGGVGGADLDYFEPYASVSTAFGPLGATVGVAYAWSQDSLGNDDNLYLYTDLSAAIPNSPISLSAHLGYTDGVLAPPFLAGTTDETGLDWSIGASATVLEKLTVGVSYIGVEGPSINGFTDDAVVGTLSVAF